jgi:hypothetical protein
VADFAQPLARPMAGPVVAGVRDLLPVLGSSGGGGSFDLLELDGEQLQLDGEDLALGDS